MARQLKESSLTTTAARKRLPPGLHWRRLDVDIHLGFRKQKGGEGTWLVRWYKGNQKYWHREFTIAEGIQEKDGIHVLDYYQASQWARVHVDGEKGKFVAEMVGPPATIKSAIENYVANKESELRSAGIDRVSDARHRLTKHVLSDEKLAETALYELTADSLREGNAY